jgi:hypothetical protein
VPKHNPSLYVRLPVTDQDLLIVSHAPLTSCCQAELSPSAAFSTPKKGAPPPSTAGVRRSLYSILIQNSSKRALSLSLSLSLSGCRNSSLSLSNPSSERGADVPSGGIGEGVCSFGKNGSSLVGFFDDVVVEDEGRKKKKWKKDPRDVRKA